VFFKHFSCFFGLKCNENLFGVITLMKDSDLLTDIPEQSIDK
jgi:hypothetical protein